MGTPNSIPGKPKSPPPTTMATSTQMADRPVESPRILGPKILGDSTGLSAIWVLVAIVVGGGLFGFAGMLLGVPTFAVLYSLVKEWAERRLAEKGIDADGRSRSPETEK